MTREVQAAERSNGADGLVVARQAKQQPARPRAGRESLPLSDTTGDVELAGDDLDRQLDRATAVGLLLDALSGHARAVAALMLHQQRRRWLSG